MNILDLPTEILLALLTNEMFTLEDHRNLRQTHPTFSRILSDRIFRGHSFILSGQHSHLLPENCNRIPLPISKPINRRLRYISLELDDGVCIQCDGLALLETVCPFGDTVPSWDGLRIDLRVNFIQGRVPVGMIPAPYASPEELLNAASNLHSLHLSRDRWKPATEIDLLTVAGMIVRCPNLAYLRLQGNEQDSGCGLDVNSVLMTLSPSEMPRLKTLDLDHALAIWTLHAGDMRDSSSSFVPQVNLPPENDLQTTRPLVLPNSLQEISLIESIGDHYTLQALEASNISLKVLRTSTMNANLLSYLSLNQTIASLRVLDICVKIPCFNDQLSTSITIEDSKELWMKFWDIVLPRLQDNLTKLSIVPQQDGTKTPHPPWTSGISKLYRRTEGDLSPIGIFNKHTTLSSKSLREMHCFMEMEPSFFPRISKIIEDCPDLRILQLLVIDAGFENQSPDESTAYHKQILEKIMTDITGRDDSKEGKEYRKRKETIRMELRFYAFNLSEPSMNNQMRYYAKVVKFESDNGKRWRVQKKTES